MKVSTNRTGIYEEGSKIVENDVQTLCVTGGGGEADKRTEEKKILKKFVKSRGRPLREV